MELLVGAGCHLMLGWDGVTFPPTVGQQPDALREDTLAHVTREYSATIHLQVALEITLARVFGTTLVAAEALLSMDGHVMLNTQTSHE